MSGVSASPKCRHVAWRMPPQCPTTTLSLCTARPVSAPSYARTSTFFKRNDPVAAAGTSASLQPVVDVAWLQRNLEVGGVHDVTHVPRAMCPHL